MNEQQLADLFSEQLDRLLAGEATSLPPEAGDLPELLEIIGPPTTQTHFQASTAAQAAFQSQLAGWFGLANGGATMTILGLSKLWFISIVVAIVTVVTGAGFIAVIATNILFFRGPIAILPTETPTVQETTTVTTSPVVSTTVTPSGTPPVVASVTSTPTITAGTPGIPPIAGLPPLIFINHIHVPSLCAGVYTAQSALVNVGNTPVDNAALSWEVIEGAELVDTVGFDSSNLVQVVDNNATSGGDPAAPPVTSTADIVTASNSLTGVVDFQPISVRQDVKLDVKVKVKDDWWQHEGKTEIKIKLSVKNKHSHPGHSHQSQVITIVRQNAQWVNLVGFPHNFGENRMLINGHTVVLNGCTGLPTNWPPGSKIQVVGWLQPDGTFIAINIIVVNINVITGNFDSGVPWPSGGGSGGGSSGGGSGGSGGSKGGCCKGGSR